MKRVQKPMIRTAAAILALLMACLLVGCTQKTDDTVVPYEEEAVIEEEVILPPVEVSMPEYELSYAGELEDLIVVEEVEGETAGLDFFVKLSGQEAPIFTLHYNTDEGELVTVLTDSKGDRIPVAFEMAQMPENLNEEDEALFYLAQETVNEIVESLKLK